MGEVGGGGRKGGVKAKAKAKAKRGRGATPTGFGGVGSRTAAGKRGLRSAAARQARAQAGQNSRAGIAAAIAARRGRRR